MDSIVIIGAGQAGFEAAKTLRSKSFEGALTLVGEEPQAPYERPPLSKAYLQGNLAPERLPFRKESFYNDKDITLLTNCRAEAIDCSARQVTLAGGECLPYDRLLIATGGRSRALPVPGAGLAGVHYLKTITDANALRARLDAAKRVVIIGGGFIGLEVAASARRMGKDVTVIEALPRLLARVTSQPVSDFFAAKHRSEGVDIRLGAGVEAITGIDGVSGVRLSDGSEIPAGLVVVGIGSTAEISLAMSAGLEIDNGIAIDAHCQTSDPHIWAAGDCTSFESPFADGRVRLESVANAVQQGKVAALSMLGLDASLVEVPWFWSDQYDVKLQMAGLSAPDDEIVVRGEASSASFSVLYFRAGRVAAIDCVGALKDFIAGKKLISEGRKINPDRAANPELSLKDA